MTTTERQKLYIELIENTPASVAKKLGSDLKVLYNSYSEVLKLDTKKSKK